MQKKSKKRFYTILGIEILIVILVALFFIVDFDNINIFNSDDVKFVDPNPPCDLRISTCKVKLSQNQIVSLSVSPKGIPLMKPLSFRVEASGIKANSLGLKLYAINMNMGVHKITLKRTHGDIFEGEQVLPTCIVGGMIWNADITSSSFANKKGVRFTFKTDI